METQFTHLLSFSTKEELAQSIAHAKSSMPAGEFLSRFVDFVRTNRLDDIERMVAEGRLESHFRISAVRKKRPKPGTTSSGSNPRI